MRLINTHTLELHDFFHLAWNDENFPVYGILSHCWTSDEVTYKDFVKKRRTNGEGYHKIQKCCDFARSRQVDWVWVDTWFAALFALGRTKYEGLTFLSSCIDKRSSAELSEAINSMYRYYSNARECYAYLNDVDFEAASDLWLVLSDLARSRWFSRGWTLQELIASEYVIFLGAHWRILGYKKDTTRMLWDQPLTLTRPSALRTGPAANPHWPQENSNFVPYGHAGQYDLVEELVRITGVSEPVLLNPKRWLDTLSVATKFSWMVGRSTTRIEDEAYCLLGIFGLSMPLLYGEGSKAFARLQAEIMRDSNDESIFAWTADLHSEFSLLAPRPQEFAGATSSSQEQHVDRTPYAMTNQGLQFNILPNSAVYLKLADDPRAPDWLLISLNCACRLGLTSPVHFMYVKRMSCGHYLRRSIRRCAIERHLSRQRYYRFADEGGDTMKYNTFPEHDCIAELGVHLTIYIHLDASHTCRGRTEGVIGEGELASCIEAENVESEFEWRPDGPFDTPETIYEWIPRQVELARFDARKPPAISPNSEQEDLNRIFSTLQDNKHTVEGDASLGPSLTDTSSWPILNVLEDDPCWSWSNADSTLVSAMGGAFDDQDCEGTMRDDCIRL